MAIQQGKTKQNKQKHCSGQSICFDFVLFLNHTSNSAIEHQWLYNKLTKPNKQKHCSGHSMFCFVVFESH
jgi:hypothetical protein